MAIRTDVTFDFTQSPRLVFVARASNAIAVQDAHDTFAVEQARPQNQSYDILIATQGKQPLPGSVLVGLTTSLNDLRIAFEGPITATSVGTVTTLNAAGTLLVDSTSTYITDGVEPGAGIINFTDQSWATVLKVVSETQLVTTQLAAGTANQWQIGDVYKVVNVVTKDAGGGNFTAVDSVGAKLNPVLPTMFTQVTRTAASSATTQEQADIRFGSYVGGVSVDLSNISGNATAGTAFPIGTPRQPVNNLADMLLIQAAVGLPKVARIFGNATINGSGVYTNWAFIGESRTKSAFIINPSASVVGTEYEDATVSGTLDGQSKLLNCKIGKLNFVDGFVEGCVLTDTVTLSGQAQANFLDCTSGIAGGGVGDTPTIDMGGASSSLVMRRYEGGITLTNSTSGAVKVSIDLRGQVVLDSTITAGIFTVRGTGRLTDNSGPSAVVDRENLIEGMTLNDIHEMLGLDPTKPYVNTPTSITVGSKTFTIVESPPDTFTLTRTA